MTDKRLAITAADLARIYRDLLEGASRNWRHTPGGGPPLIICEAVRAKLGISREDYDEEPVLAHFCSSQGDSTTRKTASTRCLGASSKATRV